MYFIRKKKELQSLELKKLKGIGDKTTLAFNKLNIFSVEDLLKYYPRRYEHFEEPVLFDDVCIDGIYAIDCIIKNIPRVFKSQSGKDMVVTYLGDKNGTLAKVSWFNMPFLKNQLKVGNRYIFRGEIKREGKNLIMMQPAIYSHIDYVKLTKKLQPIYPLKQGITNKTITKAVENALLETTILEEKLPMDILQKYNFIDYKSAIKNIHFPFDYTEYEKARKRLVFEEFYYFLLNLKKLKEEKIYEINHYYIEHHDKTKKFIKTLPFKLTTSQEKVFKEISADLSGSYVMNRLVQGDVGSGKTIVAVLAMLDTVFSGYQATLMVPTEVLANQHYETITHMLCRAGLDIKVELLTGNVTAANKRKIKEKILSGEVDMVIGTHALIEDNVEFANLALVITDEQHRFGVKQREKLENKSTYPHVLVMSATPIPRTLAIILYGDLDISKIDSMPLNRQPIKTCVINDSMKERSYRFILNQINEGHQAYVICPMVEESEDIDAENVIDYTEMLKRYFPSELKIEYLHGKMKANAKNEIMDRFSNGEIDILVSTTVIEVGINVPNATVIMIENAQRFGLAQLHQLRGRVGRGEYESYCILVNSNENEKTKKRLDVLFESNDGFYIANEDLKTRGPGDFFGVRQSGDILFSLGDIYSDAELLKMAYEAVNSPGKSEQKEW